MPGQQYVPTLHRCVVLSPRTSLPSEGVHPDLLRCINRVFVRGCEAEVLGSVARANSFCLPKDKTNATITTGGSNQQSLRNLHQDRRHLRSSTALDPEGIDDLLPSAALHLEGTRHLRASAALVPEEKRNVQSSTALDPGPQFLGTGGDGSAGSLVIHIRSGDIFNAKGQGKTHPEYGQVRLAACTRRKLRQQFIYFFLRQIAEETNKLSGW